MKKINISKSTPNVKQIELDSAIKVGEIADNTDLIDAFKMMREEGNEAATKNFVTQFTKAKLLLPVEIDPEPEGDVIKDGSTFTFYMLETSQKFHYLITFSCAEELNKWSTDKDKRVLAYDFNALKDLLTTRADVYDGIVVDPKGENFAIKTGFLQSLNNVMNKGMELKKESVVSGNGSINLKKAENISTGLIDSVGAFSKGEEDINKIYAMSTIRPGETRETTILVVDFDFKDENQMKRIFDGLANCVRDHLENNTSIGLMPYHDKIAQKAVDKDALIYER